ncbi:MAG: hypothetical protein U9N34_02560 [Candidatus Cloacimonadota bacterium]|nr:hypothetical protein [Candidatus Cloacimonadota bacterium]
MLVYNHLTYRIEIGVNPNYNTQGDMTWHAVRYRQQVKMYLKEKHCQKEAKLLKE